MYLFHRQLVLRNSPDALDAVSNWWALIGIYTARESVHNYTKLDDWTGILPHVPVLDETTIDWTKTIKCICQSVELYTVCSSRVRYCPAELGPECLNPKCLMPLSNISVQVPRMSKCANYR